MSGQMRLSALRNSLLAGVSGGTERSNLIRSAGMMTALKIGATLLAFGTSLLYARVLGPHDYGLYAYVVAWAAVLTIPASLGLPQYLVREGAKTPEGVRWLCHWADKRVVMSGIVAAVIMAAAVLLPAAAGARWMFVIAAPLPLLNGLCSVRVALLQARGQVVRGQWPALILGPTTMLAALAALWAWQGTLYPVELIAAMAGAAFLPLIANELQLRRAEPSARPGQLAPVRLRAALPFIWISGLYLLNNRADLIMLGGLKGAQDAGIYAVAARAAELVGFFLTAAAMVMAPRIARLHQQGDQALLQRLLSGATRRVLAVSAPIALLFILVAHPLLSALYGTNFADGAVALRILAGAQLFAVAVGPTGTVLNMTGHEKLSALGVGLSVVLNISLDALLIPPYGIEGAAFATGTSLVVCNVLLWHWIRRRLGLRPTAIGA